MTSSRGPVGHAPARADAGRRARADRRAAHRAHRARPRRRSGDDRLAPRARGAAGSGDLHHPPDPPRRGPRRPRAAQAPPQLLDPVRGRGAQRAVAVGLHPLAARGRDRDRDHRLARRPLSLPARADGLRQGCGRRRGRHVPRCGRGARLAGRDADRQRRGLHIALHRRPQRLRVPARLPRHPPEERDAGAPPDPGQDRALPPDASAGWGASRRRAPWPSCRPSSTASGSPTTSTGRTGRRGVPPPPRPMPRGPRRTRRAAAPRATSVCATTRPTRRAPSPCAGRAACTTCGSAQPMPGGGSWPSSTSTRSRSSPSTPASSSRATGSSPTRGTGATREETPADGRGPSRPVDHSCHA